MMIRKVSVSVSVLTDTSILYELLSVTSSFVLTETHGGANHQILRNIRVNREFRMSLNIGHIFRVSCSSVIATVFWIVTGDCSRLKICLTFRVFLHKTWWIPKICLTVRVSFCSVIETGCVSSCHFRLSRTSENLPYFPGSVMNGYHDCVLHWNCWLLTSKNLSYYPGFMKRGDRKGFFSLWLVTGDFWISAIFSGFHVHLWLQLCFALWLATVHVWKSVFLSG